MTIFRQLFDPQSSTYTYLLGDERSREAVLIDPVYEQAARDAALVRELGLALVATLETHVHADHVTGAWLLAQRLGSKILLSAAAGAEGANRLLAHGDRVAFGGRWLEARATPGHTSGCMTYVLDDERHGIHRRRAADPRLRPHRLPAGQRPSSLSVDQDPDLHAAGRLPAVARTRLPRPDLHQRRRGEGVQSAPRGQHLGE